MKTKALIAGGAAAAVLAGGGVAYAATSTPATTPGQGTSSTAAAAHRHGHRGTDKLPIDKIEHGQFVTKDKAGTQVTHDIVNGAVTAVSATSVSVKDGTGTTTTFVVDAKTHVHVKGQAKGTKSTIANIKNGETVTVVGTGTGPFDATLVSGR